MDPHSQGDRSEDSEVLLLLLNAFQRSLHIVDGESKLASTTTSSSSGGVATIAISIRDAISIRRWSRELDDARIAGKLDLGPLAGLQALGVVIALIFLDRTERGIGELDDDVLLAIIGVTVALGHSIIAGR